MDTSLMLGKVTITFCWPSADSPIDKSELVERIATINADMTLSANYDQKVSCIHGTCGVTDGQVACTCDEGYSGLSCDSEALPIEDDLVLRFHPGGVATNKGGFATSWTDSVRGVVLKANGYGKPKFVETNLNSYMAVKFDGKNDGFSARLPANAGIPVGNQFRTMFVVARFDNPGFSGVSYGTGCKNAFGIGGWSSKS